MPKMYRQVLLFCCVLLVFTPRPVHAQSLLDKPVTIHVKDKKIGAVLEEIGQQGGFYFSYDGRLFPNDSLVTLQMTRQRVETILLRLLNNRFDLVENGNYLIIRAPLPLLSLEDLSMTYDDKACLISGIVVDPADGHGIVHASVYDKNTLAATLTDAHGYFRIRLRTADTGYISLTLSKLNYSDHVVNILHPVSVNGAVTSYRYTNNSKKQMPHQKQVEQTDLGEFFTAAFLQIQSLNIPNFFATRPFQISLIPGISSQGMFSPQVINRFSFNLAGGYTAGTNGMELGGLFNINKRQAGYLQAAGIFNLVGGNVTGVQLAGVHNQTLDTLKGVQLSLFTNKAAEQVAGAQISTLYNETRRLKGLQLGLVNIADSSEGISIGLINIIRNGFYRITGAANDLANTNLSLKTGTRRFYSMLLASANTTPQNKLYALGFGMGHELVLTNRITMSTEASYLLGYTGAWDDRWMQGKALLNIRLSRHFIALVGPTYNRYSYTGSLPGYKTRFKIPASGSAADANPVQRWIGWEAGVAYQSCFKPASRTTDPSATWYLDITGTLGTAWDEPYGRVTGGVLAVHRDLGAKLTGTLATGYTHIAARSGRPFAVAGNRSYYANPQEIVPVKAGVRLKLGRYCYVASDIGVAFGPGESYTIQDPGTGSTRVTSSHAYQSLIYGVATGVAFRNGIETGFKFEDYGIRSLYKQFAWCLGYRFRLSK